MVMIPQPPADGSHIDFSDPWLYVVSVLCLLACLGLVWLRDRW